MTSLHILTRPEAKALQNSFIGRCQKPDNRYSFCSLSISTSFLYRAHLHFMGLHSRRNIVPSHKFENIWHSLTWLPWSSVKMMELNSDNHIQQCQIFNPEANSAIATASSIDNIKVKTLAVFKLRHLMLNESRHHFTIRPVLRKAFI